LEEIGKIIIAVGCQSAQKMIRKLIKEVQKYKD